MAKEEKERSYLWFVEPLGNVTHTNEVISKNLEESADDSHNFREGIICSDGQKHNLWYCASYEQAKNFWRSRFTLQIDIKIWCQEGQGQIRPHAFLLKSKTKVKIPSKK